MKWPPTTGKLDIWRTSNTGNGFTQCSIYCTGQNSIYVSLWIIRWTAYGTSVEFRAQLFWDTVMILVTCSFYIMSDKLPNRACALRKIAIHILFNIFYILKVRFKFEHFFTWLGWSLRTKWHRQGRTRYTLSESSQSFGSAPKTMRKMPQTLLHCKAHLMKR